jgi:hypothetical protein
VITFEQNRSDFRHISDDAACLSPAEAARRKELSMTKTLDLIAETIRNTKHPFRQVEDRPAKQQKNRYERRKVKEYIRLGDWTTQAEA